MKKLRFAFFIALTAVACTNNDSNDTTNNNVADSTVQTAPATDNVNGNIPDSTNTIDVGTNDGTVN